MSEMASAQDSMSSNNQILLATEQFNTTAQTTSSNNYAPDSNGALAGAPNSQRPLILITDSSSSLELARAEQLSYFGYQQQQQQQEQEHQEQTTQLQLDTSSRDCTQNNSSNNSSGSGSNSAHNNDFTTTGVLDNSNSNSNNIINSTEKWSHSEDKNEDELVEEIDGIKYRILAAVTKPASGSMNELLATSNQRKRPSPVIVEVNDEDGEFEEQENRQIVDEKQFSKSNLNRKFNSMRRISSAFVNSIVSSLQQQPSHDNHHQPANRRLSIYEMTKSPPPETSLEIYLSERRRSSTISSKQVQQQLAEQQSTFETNYCQRQQYFKDLNQKLINHDKKLLNVVANRGQIHRHSVDIAQLPLHLAQAKASQSNQQSNSEAIPKVEEEEAEVASQAGKSTINQVQNISQTGTEEGSLHATSGSRLLAIHENHALMDKRGSTSSRGERHSKKSRIIIRKFQKLDQLQLSSTPAPDVKIGQRVAHKEYYGNEFGTIRWIGRVPQICPDWTAGVEFDNAIGEGDGSLNGRRYFIAKDCFAKFLPLNALAFVDQHVGRPEPGTMISVMSAAVRPGQMISIQRVSTVHVQHCFLNAPHQIPGADILAVNTRLHCQCPNCGPCAHVIKPPRTQRLSRSRKNATHMCQFSTYTCCGMQSQEETTCTYTGNKVASLPVEGAPSSFGLPPIGNSWIEGAGYLTNLQAQQSKLMPEEYKLGAAPEDIIDPEARRLLSSRTLSSRRDSGRKRRHHDQEQQQQQQQLHCKDSNIEIGSSCGIELLNSTIAVDEDNIISEESKQNQLNCQPDQPIYQNNLLSTVEPGEVVANNQNQFAIACQDKFISYQEVSNDPHWLVYNDNNVTASNNPNKQVPKSAKVVYRDSIENRYLFPTDDPIDSTLEADLENLSQARYGPSTTNYRLNSSRNIFKSLRSLVSCLSAQSNQSELDRHSESTLRFSEYGQKSNNKAVPVAQEKLPPPLVSPVVPNKSAFTSALSNQNSRNDKEELSPPYNYSAPPVYDYHKLSRTVVNNSNSNQTTTVRRQASSSSDCGFSSASQNSINFLSHSKCSPILTNDEERRRNQIYKNFLTQLVSNTTMKSEDLLRLKRAMFEPNFGNCCLHNMNNSNSVSASPQAFVESDQNNIHCTPSSYHHHPCDKSYSELKQHCHSINSYCYHSGPFISDERCKANNLPLDHIDSTREGETRTPPKSTKDGSSISGSMSSCDESLNGTALIKDTQSDNYFPDRKCKLKPKAENKLSNNGLPKAFELKLTLSINSDSQKSQLNTEDCSEIRSTESIENNLLNSSFNVDIMSNKKDVSSNTGNIVPNSQSSSIKSDNLVDQNQKNNTITISEFEYNPTTF